MGHYASEMDGSPGPNHTPARQPTEIEMARTAISQLEQQLRELTTERDYHKRMVDKLAERIRALESL